MLAKYYHLHYEIKIFLRNKNIAKIIIIIIIFNTLVIF